MNTKKTEIELSADQKQLVQELCSLKQIFEREKSKEQGSSSGTGVTIAKNFPHINHAEWKDLAEEYGLHNWLAIPEEEEESIASITELQEKMQRLLELAEKDPLTEVSNRRGLFRQLETEIDRSKRLEISLSIALLDIDNFKQLNDFYGHSLGDHALRILSRTIAASTRKTDFIARYGGEEFVILMSGAGLFEAQNTLDRLMEGIRNMEIYPDNEKSPIHLTVSAGLMCYKGKNDTTAEKLLEFVDQAMYQAKREGKDRFVSAPMLDLQEVQQETQVQHQEKKFLLTGE